MNLAVPLIDRYTVPRIHGHPLMALQCGALRGRRGARGRQCGGRRLVAIVHDLAEPRIEASRQAQRLAQLTAVLGNVAYDNDR